MTTRWNYTTAQELPAMTLELLTSDDAPTPVDLSSGWTFTAKVAAKSAPTTTLLNKTTGITGASTLPNVTIDWSTSDWSGLPTPTADGTVYVVEVTARRTVDSKDIVFRPESKPELTLWPAMS